MKQRTLATLALVLLGVGQSSYGQNAPGKAQEHWVSTWATSTLATAVPQALPGAVQPNAQPAQPTAGGQPAAAPAKPQPIRSFNNQTLRMVVRTSIGGRRIRVTLANTFGANRLTVGAADVALRDKDSAIKAGSDRVLTFSGKPSGVIAPGAVMVSDPVDLTVPALGDLAISIFLPEDTGPPTVHQTGLHTTYISAQGNFTTQPDFTAARTANSWYFLSSVDVVVPADTSLIVAYGDSITDGATSTNNADASWPSALAKRLTDAGVTNLAVVNQGISGNRVLRENTGVNALARFDRDVLAQPGVKYVMVLEGINDISRGTAANAAPADAVTAADLTSAYRQLIDRAHEHGVKIIGCTLTPFGRDTDPAEAVRSAVNQWIRTSGAFDAVVDFEAVTKDPSNPRMMLAAYNITDQLHPNDVGYKAMADSIDLSIFGVKVKKK